MSLEYLRGDSFYFVREEPVDVRRYLPQWLNRDSLFNRVQAALSWEHERYRRRLAELARQFYIETTADFQRWEQLLRISAASGSSDELRRAVIRAKRRGGTMMTVENTKALLADFAPRGEVDIRELGANRLELLLHNGTFYWAELMEALMEQLPAHLTFSFELSRTLEHPLHVGLINLEQGWVKFDQRAREVVTQPVRVIQSELVSGVQRVDMTGGAITNRSGQTLSAGIVELIHGKIRFDCDNEIPDEETVEDFERYLLRRWAEFKQNPVIEYYRHHRRGAEMEPITAGDIKWQFGRRHYVSVTELIHGRIRFGVDFCEEDDPFLPVDTDYLRIWWRFPYETKKGESRMYLRTTTHLNPREGITAGEIKALGAIGAAGEIFVYGREQIPTAGILRAALIHKQEMRII